MQSRSSPPVVDCKAALFGLKKARDIGLNKLIIASDNQTLVCKIRNGSFNLTEVDTILEAITSGCSYFNLSFLLWSYFLGRDKC